MTQTRTPLGDEFELVYEQRDGTFDQDFCQQLMKDFSVAIVRNSAAPDGDGIIIRPAETMEALLRCVLNIMDICPSLKEPENRRSFAAAVYEDMMTGVAKPPNQS